MTDSTDVLSTTELLNVRGKTHGPFDVHAECTQYLKAVMKTFSGWQRLSPSQREALEMIAHKMGRIIAGDPNHIDHWDDISGYATLVSKELQSL